MCRPSYGELQATDGITWNGGKAEGSNAIIADKLVDAGIRSGLSFFKLHGDIYRLGVSWLDV